MIAHGSDVVTGRERARAIAEGYATIEKPPDTVAAVLRQNGARSLNALLAGR